MIKGFSPCASDEQKFLIIIGNRAYKDLHVICMVFFDNDIEIHAYALLSLEVHGKTWFNMDDA